LSSFADLYSKGFLKGNIGKFYIYNRALNYSEILWIYQYPDNPILDGLILWFDANRYYGNLALDLSDHGNRGEIHGATLTWVWTSTLLNRINLWNSTEVRAEYLVPSTFSNVTGRILSYSSYWEYVYNSIRNFFSRLFGQEEEAVSGYVEGYLKDYYGYGISNRVVVINITNLNTGLTLMLNATTDHSGYFRTDSFVLTRGIEYEIKTFFEGDDVYVESSSITRWTAPAVPPAPAPAPAVVWYYWVALALILFVILGILIAIRISKAVCLRPRKYLRFR